MGSTKEKQMFSLKGSKSVLVRMSVLTASALIVVACTGGVAPAAPAAAATKAPAATATTETAAPTETTAPAETTATTETMTTTETTTVSPTTAMTETTATTKTSETTGSGAIVVVVDTPKLGKILVDKNGMTLYVFDKDTAGKSNCTGDCLVKWPALTVEDEKTVLTPGEGVTGELAVITRDDGTYQVTANGMPLYTYQKDTKPGDVVGQAVGEVWWVVGPDGEKITKK